MRLNSSWREAEWQGRILGRRADWEETEQRIDIPLSVPELNEFLKSRCTRTALIKAVFALVYGYSIGQRKK
jgi:hypothetical protein